MTHPTPGSRELRIVYAGSLDAVARHDLMPAFERLTQCRCRGRAGGSRELALQLRAGQAQADVFLSADAEVVETELMDLRTRGDAEWYVTFATNSLVLAYQDPPPRPEIARAAQGALPLPDLLRSGLRLGRPDPEADPKGYRAVFTLQLLERCLGLPGLTEHVLGDPRNPDQIFPAADLIPMLKAAKLDVIFAYRSQAVEESLPFIPLPDEANLGSPAQADDYAHAMYRCTDGTLYRGRPITYAAWLTPDGLRSPAAAAFLVFLGSAAARDALVRHGFGWTYELVAPPKQGVAVSASK
ncbi:MAG TPA: extracellular solute-binding protein [Armatimonadota bacterium]|nr:extracellular solute-binding protein [Armatimonadota bacterium]